MTFFLDKIFSFSLFLKCNINILNNFIMYNTKYFRLSFLEKIVFAK